MRSILKPLRGSETESKNGRFHIASAGVLAIGAFAVAAISNSAANGLFSRGFVRVFGFEFELENLYLDTEDSISLVVSLAALVFLFGLFFYSRLGPPMRTLVFWLLLALTMASLFLAYMKPGIARDYYADTGDAFNYFVVPKYYEELGYQESYNCVMVAQSEDGQRLPRRMRDLSNNRMVSVDKSLTPEVVERCHDLFGPQRWEQYKADISTYRSWFSKKRWTHWFVDHGYNGTPVRSFFAHLIANKVEISILNFSYLSLLNLMAVTLMFAVVERNRYAVAG